MKLLLFLMTLGLTPPESRVDRFPQSSSAYSGCDSKEVAAGVLVGERSPRSVIFHYGKRDLLLMDIAEKTIPESDWEDFIMGEKTRFKLKRYRRGFYGTEYVEDADRFGDSTYNWLVEIKLKPSCLKASRITSLVYLPNSEEFQKWYRGKAFKTSFEQWKSQCFDSSLYPRYQLFVDYKNPDELADFIESECEKVVADYYEDQEFAFVHDYAGDLVRSWAIRDRECIEDIKGSDQYWSAQFSTRTEFWVNTCNRERNHRNNIRVWFSALSRSTPSIAGLKKFSEMVKTLKAPEDRLDWYSQELDRFAVQDFADALSTAAQRCGDAGNEKFKNTLAVIAKTVDQLQSTDVKTKLEGVCR